MTTLRTLATQVTRDKKGVAAIEFAFIAPPLFLLIMAGVDLAHQSYVRTVLQGALNSVARTAAVENPVIGTSGTTIEQQVANLIRDRVRTVAPGAVVTVTQESFFEFSNIGNPEKLMRDKNKNQRYNEADGDCYEDANRNNTYDTDTGIQGRGNANDVVFYEATVVMPRLMRALAMGPVSTHVTLKQQTAVRNQPFGERPIPPVICGAGEVWEEEDD